jgi:hypothetical protein
MLMKKSWRNIRQFWRIKSGLKSGHRFPTNGLFFFIK